MSPNVYKNFEFGDGALYSRSRMRTFSIPAMSMVAVTLKSLRVREEGPSGAPVYLRTPVYVEVMKPNQNSMGSTGPDGPVVFTQHVVPSKKDLRIGELFQSQYGCPYAWRVRVKAVDLPFRGRAYGQIKLSYEPPMPVLLFLEDRPSIDPGETWRGVIDELPFEIESSLFLASIYGAGVFSIKAKWHNLLGYGRALVTLIDPDGNRVASQEGYSQHANFISPPWRKIDLSHRLTPDAAWQWPPGSAWEVEVTNRSNQIMWDFDLKAGFDPNLFGNGFMSTFRADC